ncbi:hypothetical protein MTR_3g032650 [Medicago truncatula]|uniref:Uncharacterized protein n=1 Tax=Medicago truncatula TaxID=3880 RepID=G7IX26_MEDTR|nr:hypothetical protein MTR_3g032650 [Medicago truncatula]
MAISIAKSSMSLGYIGGLQRLSISRFCYKFANKVYVAVCVAETLTKLRYSTDKDLKDGKSSSAISRGESIPFIKCLWPPPSSHRRCYWFDSLVEASSYQKITSVTNAIVFAVGNHKPQSPVLLLKWTKSYLILRWRKLAVFGNE